MSLLSLPRDVVTRSTRLGLGLTAATVKAGVRATLWSERTLMAGLASRLDSARPPTALSGPERPAAAEPPAALHTKMSVLLDRAVRQSTQGGRDALHHRLLDELVPDEARILSALSDGHGAPLMNIYARTLAGLQGDPLLLHACAVGKQANLALPAQTPHYVTHLLALDLVETGPEDPALKQDYEILSADPGVLRATKAGSRGKVPPVIERQVLRLSPLGHELWHAATGEGLA